MTFDPVLADIRFGCGLGPGLPSPQSPAEIVAALHAPDTMAQRFPIETTDQFQERILQRFELGKIKRAHRGTAKATRATKAIRTLNRAAWRDQPEWLAMHMLRRAYSPSPFRERLESFWADHFTVAGKDNLQRRAVSPFVETAIRPHLAGRFEDMLVAAVTHPLMLHYLDQDRSTGPNSKAVRNGSKAKGLNENLARELLELHTLGVDGPYTQTDVRELAELLTGLTVNLERGVHFRPDLAEPGAETVLGQTYGGDNATMRDIRRVLRDLARHPVTAQHMARKLAVHFVSDTPDPQLVAALSNNWRATGGDLTALYSALVNHPSAWTTQKRNIKQPFDFISSALRALAVPPQVLSNRKGATYRAKLFEPMQLMGHVWQKPPGPDGLNEADSAWITPQGMAARLQWAIAIPRLLMPELPDPRVFVQTALGDLAPDTVRFAASAAETRADGIGLVLASPAFQRM